jgi:hypothetical protein
MAASSFAHLKLELDEACTFLRGFTLGHQGFTLRDGLAAIQRVSDLADQLHKRFPSGPHAGSAASAVASARTRVAAAEARLALLRRKQ